MPDIDHELVADLYRAAAGDGTWGEALSGIHRALDVCAAQFFVIGKTTGGLELAENSSDSPPDAMFDYVRFAYRIDPHVSYAAGLPVGDVLQTSKVFPREQYKDHPFYVDQWAPHGVREVLGAKVGETAEHVAMFGVTRTWRRPPFSDEDVALMTRYAGHLATALRIAKHLEGMQVEAIAGLGLMQSAGRPMMLLDMGREIIHANDLAKALIARGALFEERDGRLRCADADSESILATAMDDLQGEGFMTGKGRSQRLGLRLRTLENTVALCGLWHVRPELTMGTFGQAQAVLLSIVNSNPPGTVDPIWLGSLLDLSPAEVRVAVGLLQGEDLAGIASELRLSPETVRSQLKSLFAKTATHSQAELVAVLGRAVSE